MCFVCIVALPNVGTQPAHILLRAGNYTSNELSCFATGLGPIYYQWEKYHPYNNSWIRPSNRVMNVTLSKLIFSEITEEDEGIYHCVVTNDDGSVVSDNATITVYGNKILIVMHCYCDIILYIHCSHN